MKSLIATMLVTAAACGPAEQPATRVSVQSASSGNATIQLAPGQQLARVKIASNPDGAPVRSVVIRFADNSAPVRVMLPSGSGVISLDHGGQVSRVTVRAVPGSPGEYTLLVD